MDASYPVPAHLIQIGEPRAAESPIGHDDWPHALRQRRRELARERPFNALRVLIAQRTDALRDMHRCAAYPMTAPGRKRS